VAPPAPPGAFPQSATAAATPVEPPPPPPPVAGTYPYGYGYGYSAPPPADPRREKTLSELRQVDLRIASVKKEQRQHSLVGPVAMTGSGYLVAAAFGLAAVLEWAIAEDIRDDDCGYRYNRATRDYEDRCDVNNNGVVTKADEHDARVMARTFGAISAAGAGLGIAGTVLLMRQLAKRREYSPELYELGTRRGQLLQQLRYGGGYSSNGLTLSVSGKF
jgi:hypothetical protein